jgi:hypothetical protein
MQPESPARSARGFGPGEPSTAAARTPPERPTTRHGPTSPFSAAASQQAGFPDEGRGSHHAVPHHLQRHAQLAPPPPPAQGAARWQQAAAATAAAQQPAPAGGAPARRASDAAFTVSTAPSSAALDVAASEAEASGSSQGYEVEFSGEDEDGATRAGASMLGPAAPPPADARGGAARGAPPLLALHRDAAGAQHQSAPARQHPKRQVSLRLISLGPETEVLAFDRADREGSGAGSPLSESVAPGSSTSDGGGASGGSSGGGAASDGGASSVASSSGSRGGRVALWAAWQAAALQPAPQVAAPQTPPNQPGGPPPAVGAVAAPHHGAPQVSDGVQALLPAAQRWHAEGAEAAPDLAAAMDDTEALHSLLVAVPVQKSSCSCSAHSSITGSAVSSEHHHHSSDRASERGSRTGGSGAGSRCSSTSSCGASHGHAPAATDHAGPPHAASLRLPPAQQPAVQARGAAAPDSPPSLAPSCDLDALMSAEARARRREQRAARGGCVPAGAGAGAGGDTRARRSVRLQVSAGRDAATQAGSDQSPDRAAAPAVHDRSKLSAPWRFPAAPAGAWGAPPAAPWEQPAGFPPGCAPPLAGGGSTWGSLAVALQHAQASFVLHCLEQLLLQLPCVLGSSGGAFPPVPVAAAAAPGPLCAGASAQPACPCCCGGRGRECDAQPPLQAQVADPQPQPQPQHGAAAEQPAGGFDSGWVSFSPDPPEASPQQQAASEAPAPALPLHEAPQAAAGEPAAAAAPRADSGWFEIGLPAPTDPVATTAKDPPLPPAQAPAQGAGGEGPSIQQRAPCAAARDLASLAAGARALGLPLRLTPADEAALRRRLAPSCGGAAAGAAAAPGGARAEAAAAAAARAGADQLWSDLRALEGRLVAVAAGRLA